MSLVEGSDDNALVGNESSRNGAMRFHVFTSHNLVRDNVAHRNLEIGFRLSGEGAAFNRIVGSRACRNGVVDAAQDDVGEANFWSANRFCISAL